MLAKTKIISNDEEIQQNPDMHIDQDFPGFPHLPSDRKIISSQKKVIEKSTVIIKKPSKK